MAKINLLDIKNALKDPNFRETLPPSLKPEIEKILANPNCSCNMKTYQKIMQEAPDAVRAFFPQKEYEAPVEEVKQLMQNNWTVLNCSIGELEGRLKTLAPGRKQLSMSRWEDQVTVIINDLDVVF